MNAGQRGFDFRQRAGPAWEFVWTSQSCVGGQRGDVAAEEWTCAIFGERSRRLLGTHGRGKRGQIWHDAARQFAERLGGLRAACFRLPALAAQLCALGAEWDGEQEERWRSKPLPYGRSDCAVDSPATEASEPSSLHCGGFLEEGRELTGAV